jgi:hypothetical protein
MKTLLLFIFISILVSNLYSQDKILEKKTILIGVTSSFIGTHEIDPIRNEVNNNGYDSKRFYSIGINFVKPINKILSFETALQFSKYNFVIADTTISPNSNDRNINILSIPITLRVYLAKQFFINWGILLDITVKNNTSINDQTGMGVFVGMAYEHNFDFGVAVFINPYFTYHAFVPIPSEWDRNNIFEVGIKSGFEFQL